MPVIKNSLLRSLLEPVRETGKNRNVPLESRCVSTSDYEPDPEDPTIGNLVITFVGPPSGGSGSYRYFQVPLEVYIEFSQSESQGKYFNLYIRDSFSYERI